MRLCSGCYQMVVPGWIGNEVVTPGPGASLACCRSSQGSLEDALTVDGALPKLEAWNPPRGRIVELSYLVGLTVAETAAALGISDRTVRREWAMARAWLSRELKQD